ncbi:LysR family transcriptional regulator [Paracoccus caeni]|uniref:LysR family transcriptional regulator n=1 Tax=Paracoccus caeni TaxID=657651 RepID=A0A934SMS3_9RHOB|nr:LysR substrate-binding domain-containing protein [Paracoccus caeni]MBK4217954.1 LysR family transcriptional regulator [Paracoccus caeni]
MRIRQLHCFVVLAEELNFTRAAKRLNMSQPPLSLQIQSLERALGADLFHRSSRKMTLTQAGEVLQRRAKNILAQHDRAILEVREAIAGHHGVLDIGTTGSILRAGLADLLARFCREFPGITVRLHEEAPALQISDLISGRMDVIFNRSPPAHDDLTCELAWKEDMVVMLPADHPLGAQDTLSLDDLRSERHVILRPDSSDFAAYIMSLISHGGMRPRISQQVVDAQSIPSLVAAGFGISVLPAGIAKLTSGPLISRPIAPESPVSEIFTVYSRHQRSPVTETFLRMARLARSW